ncbi:MAG: hypothetical protein ACYCXG_07415 [Acidiferrobacter sp.]
MIPPSRLHDTERLYKALPLEERLALALRPELADHERHLILHREQWLQVRCYFARRADLRPDEIGILLDDADHVIRLCIAKRGDLTANQIERCVSDCDANVRYFVARNPGLHPQQRERLLADADPLVRRAAAKGPRAPRITGRPHQALLVR